MQLVETVFWSDVACHVPLLVGAAWSIASPGRRIYPMLSKGGVYYVMWLLFWVIFAANLAVVLLDWNSGPWTGPSRLALGIPLAVLGGGLAVWGIATNGVRNTSAAIADGLVDAGPYVFTRNPQYVGNIALFIGMAVIANSGMALVVNGLTAIVFVLAPLAEESWLVEQYGEPYQRYRKTAPRFL